MVEFFFKKKRLLRNHSIELQKLKVDVSYRISLISIQYGPFYLITRLFLQVYIWTALSILKKLLESHYHRLILMIDFFLKANKAKPYCKHDFVGSV